MCLVARVLLIQPVCCWASTAVATRHLESAWLALLGAPRRVLKQPNSRQGRCAELPTAKRYRQVGCARPHHPTATYLSSMLHRIPDEWYLLMPSKGSENMCLRPFPARPFPRAYAWCCDGPFVDDGRAGRSLRAGRGWRRVRPGRARRSAQQVWYAAIQYSSTMLFLATRQLSGHVPFLVFSFLVNFYSSGSTRMEYAATA